MSDGKDLGDFSMLELFRLEVEQQTQVLTDGLLDLEEDSSPERVEPLMRAAHSIKGAARLVDVQAVVDLAHRMEDVLVAAQHGRLELRAVDIDVLLKSVDMLHAMGLAEQPVALDGQAKAAYDELLAALGAALEQHVEGQPATPVPAGGAPAPAVHTPSPAGGSAAIPAQSIPIVEGADTADASMLELFRLEVDQHTATLTEGLLKLEEVPRSAEHIEPLMRAAHSIKGAARLVNVQSGVKLAHVMEDCLVAAQSGNLALGTAGIDVLLKSVDLIKNIGALTEHPGALLEGDVLADYHRLLGALEDVLHGRPVATRGTLAAAAATAPVAAMPAKEPAPAGEVIKESSAAPEARRSEAAKPDSKQDPKAADAGKDRVLRISAEQLNRLMGLAGESMVEARWLRPYAESMLRLKHKQWELITLLDSGRECLDSGDVEKMARLLREAQRRAAESRHILADRLAELEAYDRRAVNLSSRLHREVVASRMRPFADGVQGFPRMVRDVARSLGKQVQLQIDGQATMVDRDILEKIEAPLNHLLRNGVDHGIEMPEERERAGKPARGTIRLSAYHQSGMLSIVVEDDGRGVDLERLRRKVIEKELVTPDMAESLTESELMDFLFLPNFSTKEKVSEISGRGVGLDVVHDVVQEMRGMVRATSTFGRGTRFQLQLPLTLSVIPALLVQIAGDPYAFPLARIERIVRLKRSDILEVEGHQYMTHEGQHIGLVHAAQILGLDVPAEERGDMSVVVIGERRNSYGVVVEKFLGERSLVVNVLPRQLGKVKDISAAALMENGAPLLIVDVDDLMRSIEKVVHVGRVNRVDNLVAKSQEARTKRILVVDDSITVREVERKLLEATGYDVEVAVDGMDGWNALREGHFDLVITDIDMPRLDGIELVRMIRSDAAFAKLPVMIVSYKDREEDRFRGMEAGADYYLTKGSFHDESLREAVLDLVGAPN